MGGGHGPILSQCVLRGWNKKARNIKGCGLDTGELENHNCLDSRHGFKLNSKSFAFH